MNDKLEMIKQGLNIEGNDLDNTLNVYIEVVKSYLEGAGVPASLLESKKANGVFLKGVSDLYLNNEFTATFYQLAIQLCFRK